LVEKGCTIRLIVRLEYPTNAHSLRDIFDKRNVSICYYTGTQFHPKLYIFGNKIAFVGSSNLTENGLMVNQELDSPPVKCC
jgi:HKD family nuclease